MSKYVRIKPSAPHRCGPCLRLVLHSCRLSCPHMRSSLTMCHLVFFFVLFDQLLVHSFSVFSFVLSYQLPLEFDGFGTFFEHFWEYYFAFRVFPCYKNGLCFALPAHHTTSYYNCGCSMLFPMLLYSFFCSLISCGFAFETHVFGAHRKILKF